VEKGKLSCSLNWNLVKGKHRSQNEKIRTADGSDRGSAKGVLEGSMTHIEGVNGILSGVLSKGLGAVGEHQGGKEGGHPNLGLDRGGLGELRWRRKQRRRSKNWLGGKGKRAGGPSLLIVQ